MWQHVWQHVASVKALLEHGHTQTHAQSQTQLMSQTQLITLATPLDYRRCGSCWLLQAATREISEITGKRYGGQYAPFRQNCSVFRLNNAEFPWLLFRENHLALRQSVRWSFKHNTGASRTDKEAVSSILRSTSCKSDGCVIATRDKNRPLRSDTITSGGSTLGPGGHRPPNLAQAPQIFFSVI